MSEQSVTSAGPAGGGAADASAVDATPSQGDVLEDLDAAAVDVDEDVEGSSEDAGVPVAAFEATGEPRVDDAVARLEELDAAPTAEHVAVYEDVHRRLTDALSDLAAEG